MTRAETLKILKWFQSEIGISDWIVDISIDEPQLKLMEDLPSQDWGEFLGRTQMAATMHKAQVWVNVQNHEKDQDPAETLIHELMHIFFSDCDMENTGDRREYANNRISAVLLRQFRSDCK